MFTSPLWLILLAVAIAVPLVERARARRRASRGGAVGAPATWRPRLLWLGGLAAVIIALANPVFGVELDLIDARGGAVMLVLDVSASMDAIDMTPSRLERAKLTALDIVDRAEGNEFGLIVFAQEAYVHLPLTFDAETARLFVQSASTSMITRQGTAIADALDRAIEPLESRGSDSSVIVLLTDGENQVGDPLEAAERARSLGIRVHVIGYGTPEGDVIPVYDAAGNRIGVVANDAGQIVTTRLDEDSLLDIAEAAGSTYQRATDTGIESVAVIDSVQELELGAVGAQLQSLGVSRYGWAVVAALILLGVDIWRRREG
ncbi:MAG: VWA domain-containing protein [Chloroflexi bacterium]|nr:VWA domain-containing protein [Chloroflexota bacterium]